MFGHYSRYGTEFHCDKSNLSVPIKVKKDKDTSLENFLVDVSEMITYHAMHIHSSLNGFAGYDCIRFEITEV